MCEQLSMSEKHLGVIASIETLKEELPCKERGHGHSHNLTCVVLTEDQGNNNFSACYRIGSKYKHSFGHIEKDYDMK